MLRYKYDSGKYDSGSTTPAVRLRQYDSGSTSLASTSLACINDIKYVKL